MKDPKVIFMGLLHMLVAFSAITVVTAILGFNLPLALLFSGVGTLLFHVVTQNKLPVTLGVSAAYIGSIIAVTETYGQAYAFGGIIAAGFMYLLFGFFMSKYQSKVLKYFPNWLLSTVVLIIGLSLIPIGVELIGNMLRVGASALLATALVDLFGGKKYTPFALPFGIFVGTVVAVFSGKIVTGLPPATIEFVFPQFNLNAIITIGLIAIPTMFEMLGDTKNVGDIIGQNVFKEVGVSKIAYGNGLATIFGGLGGANAYTTYSENAGFVLQSQYFEPKAQVWTSIFFILLAFFTPVLGLVRMIPIPVFGGVVTYLFSMIVVNAVKQIAESEDKDTNPKTYAIITAMVAMSYVPVNIMGISISSVAVATLLGVGLNIALRDEYTDLYAE